jgi:hypothetical protein
MDGGGPGFDHGLDELVRVQRTAETGLRIRDQRREPVGPVAVVHVLDLIRAGEGIVDAGDHSGDAVHGIETLVRVHVTRGVGVARHLPPAHVDRLETGVHLLYRLIARQGTEGGNVGFRMKEIPKAAGTHFGKRMVDPEGAAEPDDLFGLVGSPDTLPSWIFLPRLLQ